MTAKLKPLKPSPPSVGDNVFDARDRRRRGKFLGFSCNGKAALIKGARQTYEIPAKCLRAGGTLNLTCRLGSLQSQQDATWESNHEQLMLRQPPSKMPLWKHMQLGLDESTWNPVGSDAPTQALPGTAVKIQVLFKRFHEGLELWHPDDPVANYGISLRFLERFPQYFDTPEEPETNKDDPRS